MRRVLAPLLLLLAAGLVAAGCGSDDGGGGGGSSGSAAPAKTTATESSSTSEDSGGASTKSDDDEGGESTEVRLQNIAFSPKTIKAKVGQEVEWENYDTVAHNVVATGGATFKSDTLSKGDKFKFTPTKAGTISYVCTFHPGMQAQITVTQ
jgi:plastocyanin